VFKSQFDITLSPARPTLLMVRSPGSHPSSHSCRPQAALSVKTRQPAQTRCLMILPRKAHLLYLVLIVPANTKYSVNTHLIQIISAPASNFWTHQNPAPPPQRKRPENLQIRESGPDKLTLGPRYKRNVALLKRLVCRRQASFFALPANAIYCVALMWIMGRTLQRAGASMVSASLLKLRRRLSPRP
jgi:hypothetical protein